MGHYQAVKTRVHTILDNLSWQDHPAVAVHLFLAMVILINTIAIILFTVKPIAFHYGGILVAISDACMVVFALEYILRMWSCTDSQNPLYMVTNRIRYALHPYLIIDLISILPIFIPAFFPHEIMFIRLLRLASIFKLGRFTRYSESLSQLLRVLMRKREIFVIMIFFLVFIILFSSTIMYIVEYPAQPHKFSSIPAALWWAVMTVTTVGYGDIVPITPAGKMIAGIITITGVLVLALPSAIMATGFIEERERFRNIIQESENQERKQRFMEKMKTLKEEGHISDEELHDFNTLIR